MSAIHAGAVRDFALAGRAILTVENPKTGGRFTYRIKAYGHNMWFVSVLSGPDNTADYRYLGTIRGGTYRHGRKSKIAEDALSARAFAWLWDRVRRGRALDPVVVMHDGRCGRCGRVLTTPESVRTGIGPVCAGR